MITFAVNLLGTEVLRVECGRPDEPVVSPRLEASGGGQFELGGFGFDIEHSAAGRSRDPR